VRLCVAKRRLRQVALTGFQSIVSPGSAAGAFGIRRDSAMPSAEAASDDHHAGDAPAGLDDQPAAEHHADEDRYRSTGLDQAVAADQLGLAQGLGKDRVFHRTEQRRLHAAEKQREQQQLEAPEEEAGRADRHDAELDGDRHRDEAGFFVLVGELARGRRKQEERQDEERLRQVLQRVRTQRREARGLEGEQDDERLLEYVVVQRAEKLHPEERREAPLAEQPELAVLPHSNSSRM